jgi:hypothetical protein
MLPRRGQDHRERLIIMETTLAMRMADRGSILGMLNFDERRPVQQWEAALQAFDSAADSRTDVLPALQEKFPDLKITRATLYRKLSAYREHGLIGLVPVRARRQFHVDTTLPPDFIAFLQQLACDSQRMSGFSAAYRSLFDDHLCAGKVIPGYNTDWVGIYTQEHHGAQPPARCPYVPHRCTPCGWSERNLRYYAPSKYMLTAARIGTAAGRELLPKIPSTRVGLRFGQVFITDDRFHDAQVKFAGNLNAQGVVELGVIELLTAHYCTFGMKPIRERADGTREHLREAFMRYLVADILCRIGYDPTGCKLIGEHGTARMPADLQDLVRSLTSGRFEFQTGAILNAPIAKGLMPGAARGNFRMKAALESAHGRYKNDLALLPGQKGADPSHAPEDLPAKQSYHRALMKACIALAETNPDLCMQVSTPFPDYFSYINAVNLIYERIARDPMHRLEGFAECGFVLPQFVLPGFDGPQPMTVLDNLDPEDRALYIAMIRRDPRRQINRLMSRQEAFAYCQQRSELMRQPDAIVPALLGPDLADVLTVAKDATLSVPDRYLPSRSYQVHAIAVLPSGCHQPLDRGTKWMVHLNPLNATQAFISTPDGAYVGKAPVMIAGTKFDPSFADIAMQREREAAELKRLAPIAEKRLRDRAAMTERNIALLAENNPALADSISRRQIEEKAHKGFKPVNLLDDPDTDPGDDDYDSQREPAFPAAALL